MIAASHARRAAQAARRISVLFLVLCASSAFGHGSEPHDKPKVRAVLDALPQELNPLHIQLRHTLAPQLLVANPTDKTLTVADDEGRDFLRITPDHVEADLGAAAFHRSNTLMAAGAIPAHASGTPRWHTVEATPNWGWFDLRLRTANVEVAHKVVEAGHRAQIGNWSIPVRFGDTESAISGHFEYVPAPRGIVEARITDAGTLRDEALVRALTGSARPGLFLSYRGQTPLTVLGAHGEPMLLFSGTGVQVNRHSATWKQIAPSGAPAYVNGHGVRWARVSTGQSYGWIEPRAAYGGTIKDQSKASIVKRWRIPVEIGDERSRIEGVTEWRPVEPPARRHD